MWGFGHQRHLSHIRVPLVVSMLPGVRGQMEIEETVQQVAAAVTPAEVVAVAAAAAAAAAATTAASQKDKVHEMTIMSLNCKGLRVRNCKKKRGHAVTLKRRKMLADIIAKHRPDVLMLQETWHMPHNDDMAIEGYRYYGRPRIRPDGKNTTSGGIGVLIRNSIPESRIQRRKDEEEGKSTGTMWLDIELVDGSKITVGCIYSECNHVRSLMGLDMEEVWAARGRCMSSILREDDGERQLYLLGDFNVHVKGFFNFGRGSFLEVIS